MFGGKFNNLVKSLKKFGSKSIKFYNRHHKAFNAFGEFLEQPDPQKFIKATKTTIEENRENTQVPQSDFNELYKEAYGAPSDISFPE